MKLKIEGSLWPPDEYIFIGGRPGSNKVIFTIKTEVEMNRTMLAMLLDDSNRFSIKKGVSFYRESQEYQLSRNTLVLTGTMISGDEIYIHDLAKSGWVFNRDNARHHGLPADARLHFPL